MTDYDRHHLIQRALEAERAAHLADLRAIRLTAERSWGAMDVVVAEIDAKIKKLEVGDN
jgi:hypothetical protein